MVVDISYLLFYFFKRGMFRYILFLNKNEGYIFGGFLDEGN